MSRVIQATGSSACISTPNSSWEGPTTTGRSPFLGFWPRRRRFPGSLLELTLSVKFICVAFRAFEEHAAAILPVSAAGWPGAGSPTAPWWLAFEAAYHAEEKVAFEHISCASYLHARVSLGAHMQCRGAHSQGAVREDWGVCSCKGGTRVPPLPGCPAGCARAGCPCRSLCIAKACPACKRMWLGTRILEASLSPDAPRKGLQEDGRIECGAISQVPVPEFFPYLQSICSFKGTNMFV